jgi:hypoxanthine phosphoribosyltransferase
MSIVKVKDKSFRTFITEEEIQQRVKAVAEKLNHDMAGKNPLFLAVLNGSFMFAADLMRNITIPCEISFVKLASYQGTTTTGRQKAGSFRWMKRTCC